MTSGHCSDLLEKWKAGKAKLDEIKTLESGGFKIETKLDDEAALS